MFGFPHFVLAKTQPAQDGRFGYWYADVRRMWSKCAIIQQTARFRFETVYSNLHLPSLDRLFTKGCTDTGMREIQ